MVYPWRETLQHWAARMDLRVDALGLVTILGAEEVDRSVGRLVVPPRRLARRGRGGLLGGLGAALGRGLYMLPLLGAHVVASGAFTRKRPGFTLYNLGAGIQTGELAGWLTRWLQAQEFAEVRDVVELRVVVDDDNGGNDGDGEGNGEGGRRTGGRGRKGGKGRRRTRWRWYDGLLSDLLGALLVGLPLNGGLVALTVLSGDWWGFVNAMAMVTSVFVRLSVVSLLHQGLDHELETGQARAWEKYAENWARFEEQQAAYDSSSRDQAAAAAAAAEGEEKESRWSGNGGGGLGIKESPPLPVLPPPQPPRRPDAATKAVVVTDDSRVVTVRAPDWLFARALTKNARPRRPRLYALLRALGWVAFALHLVSLGMAALATQLATVVLIIGATVLSVHKVGCDDWRLGSRAAGRRGKKGKDGKGGKKKQEVADEDEEEEEIEEEKKEKKEEDNDRATTTADLEQQQQTDDHNRDGDQSQECWIGSRLVARCSQHPDPCTQRRDLYVWLDLSELELELMQDWYLVPRKNPHWMLEFQARRLEHLKRLSAREQA
ncbi:hypothetical protein GGR56DRAFT_604444 [Xylariaceae sp. FL0804]|nr:hypothetical protein GGR56DRAFT_604444 [Xylariaceae sp. FL0804]